MERLKQRPKEQHKAALTGMLTLDLVRELLGAYMEMDFRGDKSRWTPFYREVAAGLCFEIFIPALISTYGIPSEERNKRKGEILESLQGQEKGVVTRTAAVVSKRIYEKLEIMAQEDYIKEHSVPGGPDSTTTIGRIGATDPQFWSEDNSHRKQSGQRR